MNLLTNLMEEILCQNKELAAIRNRRLTLRSETDMLAREFKTGLESYANTLKRDFELFQSRR